MPKTATLAAALLQQGQGVIDFDHFFKTLKRAGFDGPVITHGLSESEAPSVAQYLREHILQ